METTTVEGAQQEGASATREETAPELEAGYTKAHRWYELAGLGLAALSLAGAGWAALLVEGDWPLWILTAIVGIAFADLVSGLVHWGFDTWGSVDTPIVGPLAIRTFRHHHLDPKAMVGHDFVETNGHNAMLSVVLTAPAALGPDMLGAELTLFFFWSGLFVALTSQLHKWAHMEQPPKAIRLLQRFRLVLPPGHHDGHHTAPHDGGYCVTTGWMNGLLDRTGFFRALEWAIQTLTGAKPAAGERDL